MACPDEIVKIWELVSQSFREEMSETAYELWYSQVSPESYDPDTKQLILRVENEFKRGVLSERIPQIEARFAEVGGISVHILFHSVKKPMDFDAVSARMVRWLNHQPEPNQPTIEAPIENGLEMAQRSRYTFENFIVGESNKFARAACWKVANSPSLEWNPLFIYGPSGVGKTHLMYAVINELHRQNPDIVVNYTKGDEFVNYMVDCLAHQAMETFRNRYRYCDVLLVDDIQFIAGKVATQEEFFNTFQTLFDEGKQIILASDRPPRDINPLEERLRSRFEQGLLADINPPDLELRVAIIKKKAEDMQIVVPDDVLAYLSENLRSNIRQIEGAMKKLAAKSMVDGRRITMELAHDCIADMLGDVEPLNVTIDKIFGAVCKKYNVTKEELTGKKRTKEIVRARHVSIYLIRQITEMSLPNIGKIFERDHATVMASIDVVKKRMASDPLYASEINNLRSDVESK